MKKSLYITSLIFFGIIFLYLSLSLFKTEFHFTYLIDDAYIHLAIAKNFAQHSVWGMTKYQFSSSSSSPFFTLLLSFFMFIFGNNDLIPLIINLLLSFLSIYFLNKYYSSYFKSCKKVIVASLITVFFSLLYLQVLLGMEHVLQVLLFIVNINYFQRWIAKDFKCKNCEFWFYGTLLLMGLVRFESMFYFVALAFVFFLLKQTRKGILVLLFGFVPIAIFCFFNYQASGYFFPYSVVVKGTTINFHGDYLGQITYFIKNKLLLNRSFYKLGFFPLLMVCVLVFKNRKSYNFSEIIQNNFLLISFSITMILHTLFASFKGFFRYESYLMVAFAMCLIPKIQAFFNTDFTSEFKKGKIIGLCILANLFLMFYKVFLANDFLWNGGKDIYEQQIQTAKFLKKYDNNAKVVANDIGAICYFTDIHLFDIAGLGSKEMISFNKGNSSFSDLAEKTLIDYTETNKYDLAVVYEEWLNHKIPKTWKKLAVLQIKNRATVAIDHVCIYSINASKEEKLRNNIKNFNWNKNVKVVTYDRFMKSTLLQ